MIHDRGRISLNPCRDQIGQFDSYLRGIAKRHMPRVCTVPSYGKPQSCLAVNQSAAKEASSSMTRMRSRLFTERIWAFGVDDRGI